VSPRLRRSSSASASVGEVVAPPFDLAAHRLGRVVATCCGRGVVVEPCERRGGLRRGGEEFVELVAVDAQVREAFVSHPAREPVDAAYRLVLAQLARIEIELLGHAHDDIGR